MWPSRRPGTALAAAVALTLAAAPAAAEPAPPEALEPPTETSVRDVIGQPRPGEAENVTAPEPPALRERLLWIPRVVLFVPWVVTELAFVPVRTAAYAMTRFQLGTRAARMPFDDTGRAAVYPILALEAGYGADAGLLLVGRDLLGDGERIAGQLRFGLRVAERYRIDADTGHRLGPLALIGGAMYERRPRAAFYGVGQNDVRELGEVPRPVSPTAEDAVLVRYGVRTVRAYGGVRVPLPARLSFTGLGGWVDRELRDHDGPDPELGVYDLSGLAGIEPLDHYEVTGALTLDRRRSGHTADPGIYPEGGVLAEVAVSRTFDLPAPAADYTRARGELVGWASVFGGGRVLSVRAALEQVSGDLDEVPFYDLPALGGPRSVRGLRRHRFRDRSAAVLGAEYRFLIEDGAALAAFADAGAVAGSIGELAEDGVAVGFGVELSIFAQRSEHLRAQLAWSTEGELVINVIVAPEVP
jgi:hypothetical protein